MASSPTAPPPSQRRLLRRRLPGGPGSNACNRRAGRAPRRRPRRGSGGRRRGRGLGAGRRGAGQRGANWNGRAQTSGENWRLRRVVLWRGPRSVPKFGERLLREGASAVAPRKASGVRQGIASLRCSRQLDPGPSDGGNSGQHLVPRPLGAGPGSKRRLPRAFPMVSHIVCLAIIWRSALRRRCGGATRTGGGGRLAGPPLSTAVTSAASSARLLASADASAEPTLDHP